ncbi:MAG: O-antigen ligase family protein [Bacteroidota bacterium]
MAKRTPMAAKAASEKLPQAPVKISYLVLLIAYGFVTVLTPNMKALDSNGPKFLTLALLNLATFLFLFTRKDVKTHPDWYRAFFRNDIGIAYSGLMIVSLLSFFKAINVLESALHFAKIFTTFSAAFMVSILIAADKRNIRYLCAAMTLLLIYDSITVFSGVSKYLEGKLPSIGVIKSVYSNKNILASSIFVKIPFALWLMVFTRKWLRTLGISGTFVAITAILFISTRAFYLGIFVLTILIITYLIIRFIQSHDKYHLRLTGIYLILLVLSLLVYSGTERFLYPKTGDIYSVKVGARIATITDPGGGGRVDGWKRSWNVFKEEPLLGVGLGNWKIATLKEENLTSQDFTYHYKAHNDFIEITTETGIFGGLLFITIFLLVGWAFLRTLFRNSSSEWLIILFLPAFGLLCYSFDAFFNFPQDRPEIQALFVLYVGMAVAVTSLYTRESAKPTESGPIGKSGRSFSRLPMIIVYGLILIGIIFILYQNYNSLLLQRLIKEDVIRGKYTHPASLFLNGFPAIPDLNAIGEPIAAQKARYLLNEQRNDEVIALLKNDKSSPFDPMPECLIAAAYNNLKNLDSCLFYSQKAYNLKPNFFKNIALLCNVLQQKGMQKEGEAIVDKYLSNTKTNKEAWLYASSFYDKSGNTLKAASVIGAAANNFPADSAVLKQKAALDRKAMLSSHRALYDAAIGAYNTKRYADAARYYSELLIEVPGFTEALNYRANCYYALKEYVKSNLDLDLLMSSGPIASNLYNLRGVNYYKLGNTDEARKNFRIAADMGDKDGINNYARLNPPAKK